MKKFRFSHMRRWMLFYLALVLVVTAVLWALIYLGIVGILAAYAPLAATTGGAAPNHLPLALADLKSIVLLLLVSGLLLSAGLGYFWYRILSRRFDRSVIALLRALEQMARGRLNETVSIDTPDEFGRMGASINELAANLQELLLYIWKQTGQCLTMLEHIHNNPDLRHDRRLTLESMGYLNQLTESVDDLREMAKSYVFYDVSLDGNKTLAINEPGKKL
jgi:methyl-accepting chemotaxis protein